MYAKTPTVFQIEATECGAASLTMVLGYFGCFMPLEQMRIETGVSRDGCNAWNVLKAAEKFGLACKAHRVEPEELFQIKPPCIIHWNMDHFVVYEGTKGSRVILNDPAVGRRQVTKEEFGDSFTGIALSFEKTPEFRKTERRATTWKFFRSRLNNRLGPLFPLFLLGLFLVVPGLVFPMLSQYFIDKVLKLGDLNWFHQLMVLMLSCLLLQAAMSYTRAILLQRFETKMSLLTGRSFLQHLLRLPMSFFDQRYTGDVSNRVSDNQAVSEFLAGSLTGILLSCLQAVFYFFLLLFYSPWLTLVGTASLLVNILIIRQSMKKIETMTTKLQQDSGKLVGALSAGVRITSTLKASGAENVYISRILGFEARKLRLSQELSRTQQLLDLIPQVIGQITSVAMILLAAWQIIDGSFTLGMFVAFQSLYSSFTSPVSSLISVGKQVQTLKANIRRVEDIEKYPEDRKFQEREVVRLDRKLQGYVSLKDIAFGYAILEKPLIDNFSFQLYPGQTVALVGPSGSGKSTVAKVVSGLYAPWSGEMRLDNIPYDNIPSAVIHASIATVSQDVTLFASSVRDNLTLWNPAVLEADMIRAARDACIHDDIVSREGGYDAMLSEGGTNFSGGQRQRLEIARALTLNPSILILDEATSALDPITEKRIIDNIKRRGCTCIVVAHRLSAFRDSDQILVLNRGKVVQQGTHQSLMQEDGLYKKLVQKM